MATISGTITQTITLGTVDNYPTYASPITIAQTGTLLASGTGIYGPAAVGGSSVVNLGTVAPSGTGIDLLAGGGIVNGGGSYTSSVLLGGEGATGSNGTSASPDGGNGGPGSDAVLISGAGTVTNYAAIVGGYGGAGGFGSSSNTGSDGTVTYDPLVHWRQTSSGAASAATFRANDDSVRLSNQISHAAASDGEGGNGGRGVAILGSAVVSNSGLILGGDGGFSKHAGAFSANSGGNGGTAVYALGGSVANSGTIVGGQGNFGEGGRGSGGAGIVLSGAGTITNSGTVAGGAGAPLITTSMVKYTGGSNGADGGDAIILSNGGFVSNQGTISGGEGSAGHSGFYSAGHGRYAGPGGSGGTGIVAGGTATIVNAGDITGAAGAKGGDRSAPALSTVAAVGGGGGAGITLVTGKVVNSGVIRGGSGGNGGSGEERRPSGSGTELIAGWSGGNGGAGILIANGGTVINTGTIMGAVGGTAGHAFAKYSSGITSSAPDGSAGFGVVISGGGLVINGTPGNRSGVINGIAAYGSSATTVVNYGNLQSIQGTSGAAVLFTNSADVLVLDGADVHNIFGSVVGGGGTLDLGASAGSVISGLGSKFTSFSQYAVLSGDRWTMTGANTAGPGTTLSVAGTLVNSGNLSAASLQISGTFNNLGTVSAGGVSLTGGQFFNAASAGVTTSTGIYAAGATGVTLTNYGTIANISGASGTAVSLGGAQDTLIDEAGATFGGQVLGGGGLIELAGSGGVATFGASLQGFGTLQFVAGAQWSVYGSAALLPGIVSGFAVGDLIDVYGFSGTSDTYTGSGLVLSDLSGDHVTLGIKGHFTTTDFLVAPDGSGGTDVTTTACYCRGTLILTEDGEVAIEELAIGDRVVTVLSGEAKPVRWIGRRAYDGRFVAGNKNVLPICITAGALADGVPARNLWVSPEHSLYIDDVLVQVKHLVNGASVVQPDSVDDIEYFHIELEAHDVIYADGTPAETFIDCDNRLMFANGHEYPSHYPEDDRARWQFCAPRLEYGSAELTTIREYLFQRGRALALADDRDLAIHLIVDGEILPPASISGGIYRFEIPAGCGAVWLSSPTMVPSECEAASRDKRILGVALERIVLSDPNLAIEARHGHPELRDGFHADEPGHRWTDGHARIPDTLLRHFTGPVVLELSLVAALSERRESA